jgi:hypothetical protein
MAETITNSAEVIKAGGFRIEIRLEELTVCEDRTAFDQNAKKRFLMIFLLSIVFWFIPSISIFFDPKFQYDLSLLWLKPGLLFAWPPSEQALLSLYANLVLVVILITFFIALRKGKMKLRCTPDVIEVIDLYRGRVRKTYSYARSEVKKLQYDARLSILSESGSLVFNVRGERMRCFSRLKCLEAQRILDELRRMGYDIVRDPGMKMSMEMEQTRRKRPFVLFP